MHWWPQVTKNIFGLHHDCELLEWSKFNPTKCDFYPAHHILEDRFEALILDALQLVIFLWLFLLGLDLTRLVSEEHTNVVQPTRVKLVEGLQQYFAAGGPLVGCSFEQLSNFASTVYTRYLCTAAYEAALGHSSHDPAIYGPSHTSLAPSPPTSVPISQSE